MASRPGLKKYDMDGIWTHDHWEKGVMVGPIRLNDESEPIRIRWKKPMPIGYRLARNGRSEQQKDDQRTEIYNSRRLRNQRPPAIAGGYTGANFEWRAPWRL